MLLIARIIRVAYIKNSSINKVLTFLQSLASLILGLNKNSVNLASSEEYCMSYNCDTDNMMAIDKRYDLIKVHILSNNFSHYMFNMNQFSENIRFPHND